MNWDEVEAEPGLLFAFSEVTYCDKSLCTFLINEIN